MITSTSVARAHCPVYTEVTSMKEIALHLQGMVAFVTVLLEVRCLLVDDKLLGRGYALWP